jgi:hypothetical protein
VCVIGGAPAIYTPAERMASLRHTIGELGAPAKLALGALVATVGGGGVYFLSTYEVLLLHVTTEVLHLHAHMHLSDTAAYMLSRRAASSLLSLADEPATYSEPEK